MGSARARGRYLAKARRYRLRWTTLAVAIASAQGIYAQSADQGLAEEIVVTGSRIRLDGMNTPNPSRS